MNAILSQLMRKSFYIVALGKLFGDRFDVE